MKRGELRLIGGFGIPRKFSKCKGDEKIWWVMLFIPDLILRLLNKTIWK